MDTANKRFVIRDAFLTYPNELAWSVLKMLDDMKMEAEWRGSREEVGRWISSNWL